MASGKNEVEEEKMAYLTDIEIAQQCEMKPIMEIAKKAHVDEKYV